MNGGTRKGFTLLELLTALVVLAVLVAIAIPTWRQHVLRTQRAGAHELLQKLQLAQEKFFGRHARYATSAELSLPEPTGLGLPSFGGNPNYRLSLDTAADGLAFTATAHATDAQSADTHCTTFTVDQVGLRTATDANGADKSMDCWR